MGPYLYIFFLLFSFNLLATPTNCLNNNISSLKIASSFELDYYLEKELHFYANKYSINLAIKVLNEVNNQNQNYDLSKFDSIIIPGGADIDPLTYIDRLSVKAQNEIRPLLHLVNYSDEGEFRDSFEISLVDRYLSEANIKKLPPFYGICRGMQVLLVASGIPLYLDINHQVGIKNRINLSDRIFLENIGSTTFQEIFNSQNTTTSFLAYKWHHQGANVNYIDFNSNKFAFTAFSNNRQILESFEFKNLPILGVQFHPENSGRKIKDQFFTYFFNKACER